MAGLPKRAARLFRTKRDKAQLTDIHNTWIKNRVRPKIYIRELTWWKPRKAGLLISKICYSVRKHLHAARPASPSWAKAKCQKQQPVCQPHIIPWCRIWNPSGLPGNHPRVQLQCSMRTTVLGKVLGQRVLPTPTSPPNPSQPQEAHVLCKPWGNITGIAYEMLAAALSFLIPSSAGILWLNPWVQTSYTTQLWTPVILRWWAQIQCPLRIKIDLFPLSHDHASSIGLQGETSSICTFPLPSLYLLLAKGRKTLVWVFSSPKFAPAEEFLALLWDQVCRMKRLDVTNEQSCSPFLLLFCSYNLHSCPAELG